MRKRNLLIINLLGPSLVKNTRVVPTSFIFIALVIVALAHAANAFNPRANTDLKEAGPNRSIHQESGLGPKRKPTEDKRRITIDTISIGIGKRVKKVKKKTPRSKDYKNGTKTDVCTDKDTKKTYPEGEAWPLPGCRRGKCIENGKAPSELTVQVSECLPPKVKEGCKSNSGNPIFPFPLCCPTVSCEISSKKGKKKEKKIN